MSQKFDVVVFGSCIVDFISYVPRLPKVGETLHGSRFETGFGGKGANQCVAAARLGSRTAIVGKLGNDTWGKNYRVALRSEGINVDHVDIVDGESTGIAQINVAANGDNQIVIVVGANNRLLAADVQKCKDLLDGAKVLVCQLETPSEGTIEALKHFSGVSIMNAAPGMENIPIELLTLPTIFCVNESEAALITNMQVETVMQAKDALLKLRSMGCGIVIITLGEKGAIFQTKDSSRVNHVKPYKVDKVVDTTGAGDAFIGALAHFIARNPSAELTECISAANQVAAFSVQKTGTQTSFPRLSETGLPEDASLHQCFWEYI
ncbi:ribokinase [Wyeomyia smithii]|uniref:ribokinase n=1 Tax=Wyeomyia smithii TaxID=174621 RepID=UPI0024681ACB|nr:ribokinase [Wyeomyia smithii]XP_055544384.1 ribokinase [Wyeomyia smithii]XP_055544385.1 ribokinase [Wyeomyia smithii]XP_055544386.1 ribokinase [Wyeomyia smithii]